MTYRRALALAPLLALVLGWLASSAPPAATSARAPTPGLYGIRWDPCQPISYRILPRGGYAGSTADLRRAFRTVARATGITFVYAGSGPADVTVRWTAPARTPFLRGPVAGWTTTTIDTHDGLMESTRGVVRLDRTARLRPGFARTGPTTWGQAMLHELGHLVGLGHVSDPTQLMYYAIGPRNHVYGKEDLRLLHLVGRAGGCVVHSAR